MRQPIVIVPACSTRLGSHPYHTVQFKYVDAVAQAARCAPLILPALGGATDLEAVLNVAHGVMLTGSASNVDPGYYGQTVHNAALPQDAARDATTLPLIRARRPAAAPRYAPSARNSRDPRWMRNRSA